MSTILRSFIILLFATSASATTGDTLKNDLRIRLGQTSNVAGQSNWTNAELYRCLNMAQDVIEALGRAVEKQDTLQGGRLITPPSDFKKLQGTAFSWRNGRAVKPIPLTNLDSASNHLARLTADSKGRETWVIYQDAGRIVVEPGMSSGDSIVISYYASAAKLDSATECGFPDEWEQLLLVYAKMIALEKIRDVNWYTLTATERDKLLQTIYASSTLRPQLTKVN